MKSQVLYNLQFTYSKILNFKFVFQCFSYFPFLLCSEKSFSSCLGLYVNSATLDVGF